MKLSNDNNIYKKTKVLTQCAEKNYVGWVRGKAHMLDVKGEIWAYCNLRLVFKVMAENGTD